MQIGLKVPFINTFCLQKSINIMGKSGGGKIHVPYGTYRMPKMRNNVSLVGKVREVVKVKKER